MANESLKTGSFPCTGAACKKGAVHGDERISRREFFKLGRRETGVIPGIDRESCPRPQGCGICAESCTAHAIRLRNGDIRIDRNRCVGCGACTVACPRGALIYPGFPPGQTDLEIERLLQKEADRDPRIIAFTCAEKNSEPIVYPENVVPLHVPSLAMVSPWMILQAFIRGAQGAVLVPAGPGCGLNCENTGIGFLRELFMAWSIEPFRIHVWSGAAGELEEFVQAVKRLPVLRLTGIQAGPVREKELPLAGLIGAMEKALGPSAAPGMGKGIAPFGIVQLNPDRCTGCGLCGLNCPTEALTFSPRDADDSYRILFRHDRCAGCGVCRKSCPEKAIAVERILQIGKLARPAAILFEDRLSSCSGCGAPLFPRAMVLRLKARLSAAGEPAWAVDLCPSCRLKNPLFRERLVDSPSREITV